MKLLCTLKYSKPERYIFCDGKIHMTKALNKILFTWPCCCNKKETVKYEQKGDLKRHERGSMIQVAGVGECFYTGD